jgi:hypothetical protein
MPPLDEGELRALVPRVLAGLVRRGEDLDIAEDALQEALIEALRVWPEHPADDPRAWLTTVAARRLVDARRSETARARREEAVHAEPPPGPTEDRQTWKGGGAMNHRSVRPGILFLVIGAALVMTALPAFGAGYGRVIGHAKHSGSSSATDIGWGPTLMRSTTRPHYLTLKVAGKLRPGYFCTYEQCHNVNVHWDVACSKPGIVRSREGGMTGRPPKVGHPKLPFRNPRKCTIQVNANPNAYVGGWLEIWLYKK